MLFEKIRVPKTFLTKDELERALELPGIKFSSKVGIFLALKATEGDFFFDVKDDNIFREMESKFSCTENRLLETISELIKFGYLEVMKSEH